MKKIIRYITASTTMICCLASCSQELTADLDSTNNSVTPTRQITLSAQEATRTSITETTAAWASGDAIAVVAGENLGATPAKFSVLSGIGSSEGRFTGELVASNSFLYALYPYQEGLEFYEGATGDVYINITQPTEQHQSYISGVVDASSIGDYCYMWGKSTEEITEDNTLASVSFDHLMAILDFNLRSLPTPDQRLFTSMSITSSNHMLTSRSLNMDDSSIENGDNTTSTITINIDNYEWSMVSNLRLALLPQTIEAGCEWSITFNYDDGTFDTRTITFANQQSYEAGRRYIAEEINVTGLEEDDYPAIGDFFYEDGTFSKIYIADVENPCIGIIYYINSSNPFSGKIVSIYQTLSIAWSEDAETLLSISSDDGLENMQSLSAISAPSAWSTTHPAFGVVHAMNDSSTSYLPGTEGIWYLPSFYELRELYCGICGVTLVATGTTDYEAGIVSNASWSTTDKDATLNTNPSIYRTAKEAFNAKISEAGGNTYAYSSLAYWSSSEHNATQGLAVWFDGANRNTRAKDYVGTLVGVRPVRLFSGTTPNESN